MATRNSQCFYVYLHTNKLNGKMYVGITSRACPELRWGVDGVGYTNSYFGAAIQKYGWDNFSHEYWVVDSEEAMKQCEIDMIAFFNTKAPNGYNLTDGGEGTLGYHPSDDTKNKIRIAHLGTHCSEDTKEAMSNSHLGKQLSAETIRKIAESQSGENAYWYGKHQSAASNKKRSATLKGKPKSDAHKKAISEGQKGKPKSEASKEKNRQSHLGRVPWNKGKHNSAEANEKNRQSHLGKKWKIVDGKRVWYTVKDADCE